ncbi:MAG: hypothetical protein WBP13_05630 [Methylophilaceae bacterium]
MTTCMIFYPSHYALNEAEQVLRAAGLNVQDIQNSLLVSYPDAPLFTVLINSEAHVAIEAAEIGRGTPYAEAMAHCHSRFEIHFEDLDAALDEINTLMTIQSELQDLTHGYLFLPWNGSLTEP